MSNTAPWVVVDVETTGLDAHAGHLLEIAAKVIDPVTLEPISEAPFHAVVQYTPLDVEGLKSTANDAVYRMHIDNGLWADLTRPDALPLHLIEKMMVEWLIPFGAKGTMPVMGNSVRLDMNFIDVHLPLVGQYLDYHMRDVSTIAGIAADWYGAPWFPKTKGHRALADVDECIEELKHYRKYVFQALPGTASRDLDEGHISLNSEQAGYLMRAVRANTSFLRHDAEPWPSQARREEEARDADIEAAVALGVPRIQALRFVYNGKTSN